MSVFYEESLSLEKWQIILSALSKAVKELADNPDDEFEEEKILYRKFCTENLEFIFRAWNFRFDEIDAERSEAKNTKRSFASKNFLIE